MKVRFGLFLIVLGFLAIATSSAAGNLMADLFGLAGGVFIGVGLVESVQNFLSPWSSFV